MGFRFRKSVKILPGVKVNISKKGVSSVSVGKRGANVNIGKNGTHANIGLKGTGLSYRAKIADGVTEKEAQGGCASFLKNCIKMLLLGILGLILYAAFIGPKEPASQKAVDKESSHQEEPVGNTTTEPKAEPSLEPHERGKTDKLDNLF